MLGFDALAKLPIAALPGDAGQVIYPPLVADDDSFFTATVTPGAVTVEPGIYSDPDTFFGPQANIAIYPGIYTDGDSFFSPQVNTRVFPSLFTDGDVFFGPEVIPGTVTLYPPLFEDGDEFFGARTTISILPGLFVDSDIFFSPVVGIGTPPQNFAPNICMVSGVRTSPRRGAWQWNGIWVRPEDYEDRHPQELVRGVVDDQRVAVPRPEAPDVFISAGEVTADSL